MENNYICPKTGKEFFFAEHRTVYRSTGKEYTDRYGKQLLNPENGVALIPIEVKWNGKLPTVFSSQSDRHKKHHAYFKDRAKKHANTDEEKAKRKEVEHRELTASGYTPKE